MRPRRGTIVRPLLEVSRAELHRWLASQPADASTGWQKGAFRTDVTNADVSIPRNRVRHQVLPLLEQAAPGAASTIARAARLSADDDDFLSARVIEAVPGIVLSNGGTGAAPAGRRTLRVDLQRLKSLHPAIGRRAVRRLLEEVAPDKYFGLKHVDALLELSTGRLDLPGVGARIDADGLVLTLRSAVAADRRGLRTDPSSNVFRYPLSIPGEVLIPESGVVISAELVEATDADGHTAEIARLESTAGETGLAVRNRRPGDRFRPVGLGGSKKLQDYFVDRKVPRSERDRVPLVVDARDRIVWVVGHTIAEGFGAGMSLPGRQGPVLLLKVRYLGESV
jgi:tRNA(Ile)-lysidine synthase